MMYTTRTASSPSSTMFLSVICLIAVAAGAVIVMEALRMPHAAHAGQTAVTFGLMLVSLAGVVLSVVLPDRIGKAILLVGSAGFFACLVLALLSGARF
jgi:hypothetical protein